jgi:hypothetical protein
MLATLTEAFRLVSETGRNAVDDHVIRLWR